MSPLATKISHIDSVRAVILPVLNHFARKNLDSIIESELSYAVDYVFKDDLLFQKFQMWNEDHDDEVFLFHIHRFFEKNEKQPLSPSLADATLNRVQAEDSIKETVRKNQKRIFGERITALAIKHNLLTNEDLGDFLGVSGEQARKFKAGENKPQLSTLRLVADKFKVSPEYLMGLKDLE